jgi:hypothetical protein
MNTFLHKLTEGQRKNRELEFEYNGIGFLCNLPDTFESQRLLNASRVHARKMMEEFGDPAEREIPGTSEGTSKWDESTEAIFAMEYSVRLMANCLRQKDGSAIWTTDEERAEFESYIRNEIPFVIAFNSAIAKKK